MGTKKVRRESAKFGLTFAAFLALCVILLCALVSFAGNGFEVARAEDIRVEGAGVRPQLFFACELDTPSLQLLIADPTIIANLKDVNAGVALALNDLSPARAQVVRELNQAGIPMVAWIVLPMKQGYYLNAYNASGADRQFTAFEKWTADYGLKWVAVGLDMEPNFSEFSDARTHKLRLAATLLRRSFNGAGVQRARQAYSALIRRIQSDGYAAETYQMFFLADERRVHSTVLERLLGIVDVTPDTPGWKDEVPPQWQAYNEEVLMVYTSFNHQADAAPVWEYGPEAQALAVGSTARSGDAAIDAKYPPLNWDELSRNLIVESHFSRLVGVYSLEGCVREGYLSRFKTLDWNQPVVISADALRRATRFRRVIEDILWTASRLPYFMLGFLVAVTTLIWWRRSRKQKLTA